MKFIDLRRDNGKTPFDTVLNTGCGPTFVLNRKKYFYFMVKGQSLAFWFRFWLTFCLNPGCSYLDNAFEEFPELMLHFSEYTHEIILQGTDDEICNKCFDLLMRMLPTLLTQNPIYKKKSVESVYKAQMSSCLDMAFGCALCEVFYKWLNSQREDEAGFNFYWQIPEKYLNPQFLPGIFEQFIVNQWKENFVPFLGVTPQQVPWVEELLSPPGYDMIIPDLNQRFELSPPPESDINLWLRKPAGRTRVNRSYSDRWHYSIELRALSKNIRESLWLKRNAILRIDEKQKCSILFPTRFKISVTESKNSKSSKSSKSRIFSCDSTDKSTASKLTNSTQSERSLQVIPHNLSIELERCSYCKLPRREPVRRIVSYTNDNNNYEICQSDYYAPLSLSRYDRYKN